MEVVAAVSLQVLVGWRSGGPGLVKRMAKQIVFGDVRVQLRKKILSVHLFSPEITIRRILKLKIVENRDERQARRLRVGCGGESDRVEFRIGKSSTLTPRLTARLAEAYAIMRTC